MLIMIGSFPPPVHGVATVNAAILSEFQQDIKDLEVINIGAKSLHRGVLARLSRIPRILTGLWQLAALHHTGRRIIYLSVSGGHGQVYECLFLTVARLRRMQVYLHHHSFAYLNSQRWVTQLLTVLAGESSVHITQCPGMTDRLLQRYSKVRRAVSISNTTFLIEHYGRSTRTRDALKTIGFISNISMEKGVFEFLQLVTECEAVGHPIKAKLAGPFQDTKTERNVRNILSKLHSLEYVGPRYGMDKWTFFNTIDLLIFPTLYNNETEGIVNHESMMFGAPIIAYGRGCIPEIVRGGAGLVIDPNTPFVPKALAQIRKWLKEPYAFSAASEAAKRQFNQNLHESKKQWGELTHCIFKQSYTE